MPSPMPLHPRYSLLGIRLRIITYTGGGGGNEERNGLSITIPVPVPITSPITSPITKDIAARSGAWPPSGSGPRSWPSKGTFVLQIFVLQTFLLDYYQLLLPLLYFNLRCLWNNPAITPDFNLDCQVQSPKCY